MTLSQLTFLEENNLNFPWEKSQWNNTAVKKKKSTSLASPENGYGCSFKVRVVIIHTAVSLSTLLQ